MHFCFFNADLPLQRACCMAMLCAMPLAAQAFDILSGNDQVTRVLPDLHGSDASRAELGVVENRASLVYRSREEKWEASIDQLQQPNRAATLDYGRALNKRFSAGASLTRENDKSEVVLNGIFAPKKNTRVRVTGARLQAGRRYFSDDGDTGAPVRHNAYLVGARKYWTKYAYLGDLGLTAYTVNGSTDTSASSSSGTLVPGRQNGFALQLNLRPGDDSRLELQHEQRRSRYTVNSRDIHSDYDGATRIAYARHFDDCLRLQGGYSSTPFSSRFDIHLTRKGWGLMLAREQDETGGSTMIGVGYTMPLDRHAYRRSQGCSGTAYSAPSYEPLAETAAQRPEQFPRDPLAIIHSR